MTVSVTEALLIVFHGLPETHPAKKVWNFSFSLVKKIYHIQGLNFGPGQNLIINILEVRQDSELLDTGWMLINRNKLLARSPMSLQAAESALGGKKISTTSVRLNKS